ncbi:hypothetical protein ITP53_04065 [Nonomuraea sp. K274]|uniref:Apea-like HEPN domain-containing protein n=1 Tax=Nonomuraea cypriaca TaxID=1187855 RepID=A0A931EWY0_9ACTN|nr:HEPN domain-containing protein [Nonomuraea cypriaca]MBF8184927.1 hypothetical protein [Nonomuraea cypriaca]
MTPEHLELVAALVDLISDARPRAGEHADLTDRETADAIAESPAGDTVRRAANAAARANGYLNGERGDRHAGRALQGDALFRLGVAALLRSNHEFNAEALAGQLAAYLAGPPEDLWRYFVLNIDWELPRPTDLGGWRLSRPGADEWRAQRPVPIAADHAATQAWDPLLESGWHVVLATPDPELAPVRDLPLRLFSRGPSTRSVWAPLLAVNLWSDEPARVVAEYVVEPGRTVDCLYSSIPYTYIGSPGDECEVPLLGPLHVDDSHSERLIRFLTEITTRLTERELGTKLHDRIRRSALRFLSTSDMVGYRADVTFSDDEPQVVLNYVTSLENLLSGGSESHTDLSRRTAQRAAVLIGENDGDRLRTLRCVKDAYNVRSSIAHGSDPRPRKLTEAATQVRSILRRALVAAIVLGEAELGPLCDEALLSQGTLRAKINNPLAEFYSLIHAP